VEVTTIGIDVAKDVFGLHGVDAPGRVKVRKRLVRKHLLEFPSPPASVRRVGVESSRALRTQTKLTGTRLG
jgi:transposase